MFHIVLVQPEIPSNTGNIGRLCVATNSHLHLTGPLGFSLDDKYLKRAGLDYWPYLDYTVHFDYDHWFSARPKNSRFFFFSTKAHQNLYGMTFKKQDFLVFGPETRGLSAQILKEHSDKCFRIPMPGAVRSLNLSNAVSIVVYEALRQVDPHFKN